MRTPITRTVIISANATVILPAGGRALTVLSSTGPFTARVNNGPAAPMVKGRGFGGPASAAFDFVELIDTSGAENTVVLYIADEQMAGAEQLATVSLTASEVSLSAATIAAIEPPAEFPLPAAQVTTLTPPTDNATRTPAIADITGSTAYTNKKFIEVHNIGGANITVGGFTLAPTEYVVFPMLPNREIYASVTVNATGSTARVITVE